MQLHQQTGFAPEWRHPNELGKQPDTVGSVERYPPDLSGSTSQGVIYE